MGRYGQVTPRDLSQGEKPRDDLGSAVLWMGDGHC